MIAAASPDEGWRSRIHDINERHDCSLVGSVDVEATKDNSIVVTDTCLFDFRILPCFTTSRSSPLITHSAR